MPSALCPSPGRPAPSRSSPTFSYQLHFDWQPGFLPPACESGSATVGTPVCGPITVFFASVGSQRYLAYSALATLRQLFLTDHTLTGRTIFQLSSGDTAGLMSDIITAPQCVLTVKEFRTTSAHCDDRGHCTQRRVSRTCPTAAPVWRLGCSGIFFTASN